MNKDLIKKAIMEFRDKWVIESIAGKTIATFTNEDCDKFESWLSKTLLDYGDKVRMSEQKRIREIIGKMEQEKYKKCPTKAHDKHEYCCYIGNICLEAYIKNKFRRELLAKIEGGNNG